MITANPEIKAFSGEDKDTQRKYDLQTQFAELVDGSMRTEFELTFTGDDLIGEDGRSLDKTTRDAQEDIDLIIQKNPELWFEKPRRETERQEFEELIPFARGEGPNVKVAVSDRPWALENTTVDTGGYNGKRRQAMLRVYTRSDDGQIKMYSRSLDGSNRLALECIYDYLQGDVVDGELLGQRIDAEIDSSRHDELIDELTDVYDKSLTLQFGGQWHAGRNPIDHRNTYDFVCRQDDIIDECIRLDNAGYLNRNIMYNMAAAMNKRFELDLSGGISYDPSSGILKPILLLAEIEQAGADARALGITFSACGDTLGAENNFESSGFGNNATDDEYGPLVFKCTKGHKNVRPRGKLIPNCEHCGISVKC